MARKNSTPNREKELLALIANYEKAKADNQQLYLDGDQFAQIVDFYATDRRFDEAQEVITYGLSVHPGNTDLLIEQAYLYLDTMQLTKAKNVAECITETYETEVRILKAEILLNEGKLDDAEAELNFIEEKEELDTIIDITYLFIDMGYSDKALPWLKRGQEMYNNEEDYIAAVADCYRAGNETEKAIDYYNKLIDIDPYNPAYWIGLAKCNFALQDFSKTLEACDFALAADEEFGEAHVMKAHCLFYLENNTEAIEEYKKALHYKSLPPEFTYMFIGMAYANMEDWEQSYEYLQKSIDSIGNGDSAILTDVYCNQAFTLVKLGRCEDAHQLCSKAKEKSPDNVDIYLQEGRLYLEEDKFDEAKECWRLALRYAPEAETLVRIGNYSLDYGMIESARLCFEEAREEEPDYPGINSRLASVCMLLRDHKGFYKYNQLSENPLNLDFIRNTLSQNTDPSILKDLEKFITEVYSDDKGSNEFTNDEDEFTDDKNKIERL